MHAVLAELAILFVLVGGALPAQAIAPAVVPTPQTNLSSAPEQPLYLVKEIVEVTSDHGSVDWSKGPRLLATRHRVLEGAQAPGFEYRVSGLDVWVGKRQFDTTRVVIEVEALALPGNPTASVFIVKGALESVGADVYAYDQTLDGFTQVAGFLADGPEGGAFERDLATLYALPAAIAQVQAAAPELEKKVFAFYYPWYATPRGPSGRWFHWDGTFTDPSGEERIATSTDYPLLGAYDSGDERVISAHMAMATHAGIDGFIASWWGISTFEDLRMPALLAVADQADFSLSVYYESARDLRQEDIVDELSYVVQAYGDHPAFLKDSGRPVLFIYCVPCGPGRDPSFWLEIRRAVEARVGSVVLLGDIWGAWAADYVHAFDGFHAYIYLGDDPDQVFREGMDAFELGLRSSVDDAFLSAYAGSTVPVDRKHRSVTTNPGFHFYEDPAPVRAREDGARYAALWSLAIDLAPSSVLITSWNEWHEGTEIEPSREYGFDYLRMTRQFSQVYKQTSLPALDASLAVASRDFAVDSNKSGSGIIAIASPGATPLVALDLEVEDIEGTADLGLQGDFYVYIGKTEARRTSIAIPSVNAGEELDMLVQFRAQSAAPVLEIHAAAYDPLGNRLGASVRLRIADVTVLSDRQRALEALIRDLEAALADLEAELAVLEAEVANLTQGMAAMGSQVRGLTEQVWVWQLVAMAAAGWAIAASLLLILRKRKGPTKGGGDSGAPP